MSYELQNNKLLFHNGEQRTKNKARKEGAKGFYITVI